jgi:hypothetical protein
LAADAKRRENSERIIYRDRDNPAVAVDVDLRVILSNLPKSRNFSAKPLLLYKNTAQGQKERQHETGDAPMRGKNPGRLTPDSGLSQGPTTLESSRYAIGIRAMYLLRAREQLFRRWICNRLMLNHE